MLSLRRDAQIRNITPALPDWTAAFGRDAPVEVDLGCGRGEYAFERALRFPEVNVIALDVRKKWIEGLQSRCIANGVLNLRAVRCDVREDLSILFAEHSISAITINHPDPWWKKRHRKRRLVQPEFVDLLARLLVPEGWVFIQTDVPDLADEIEAAFLASPVFHPLDASTWKSQRLGDLRSHREKRCLRLGLPIRRLAFVLAEERRQQL